MRISSRIILNPSCLNVGLPLAQTQSCVVTAGPLYAEWASLSNLDSIYLSDNNLTGLSEHLAHAIPVSVTTYTHSPYSGRVATTLVVDVWVGTCTIIQ